MSVKLSYYGTNREKILARARQRYQESLEYLRQYRLEHREEIQKKAKEKRAANPEPSRAANRRYYARNREILLKKRRENYQGGSCQGGSEPAKPSITAEDVERQIDAINERLLNEKFTAKEFEAIVSKKNALEIRIIQLKNPVHSQKIENPTYKF